LAEYLFGCTVKSLKTALIFFFAVLSEVTATTALKFSEGFTKFIPSVVVMVGYGLSFYFFVGLIPRRSAA